MYLVCYLSCTCFLLYFYQERKEQIEKAEEQERLQKEKEEKERKEAQVTKDDDVKAEDIEPTQKDIHDNIGLVDQPQVFPI